MSRGNDYIELRFGFNINKQTKITLLICKTITSSIKMSYSPNKGITYSAPLPCCSCNLPLGKTQADGAILVNLGVKTILIDEPTCATKIWRYCFFCSTELCVSVTLSTMLGSCVLWVSLTCPLVLGPPWPLVLGTPPVLDSRRCGSVSDLVD